ncbi:hypothetical protein [Alkaliphilus oremlandii]|uniref:hypothetical protein n=1 Tax=Alkaliphilus oremlandii TaxID=461876 RepID=UPI0005A0674D|nr:hypothetical protein [Alkaliphilus oremlandii]
MVITSHISYALNILFFKYPIQSVEGAGKQFTLKIDPATVVICFSSIISNTSIKIEKQFAKGAIARTGQMAVKLTQSAA